MSSFQINTTDPPNGTAPGGRSCKLERPETQGNDGLGYPCGAIGLPRVRLSFLHLSVTGWAWYVGFVEDALSADITSLRVWDPHKVGGPGWTTFSNSGIMHRPTFDTFEYGSYRNVEILITELS